MVLYLWGVVGASSKLMGGYEEMQWSGEAWRVF